MSHLEFDPPPGAQSDPLDADAEHRDRLTTQHGGATAIAERTERAWELRLQAGSGRLDVPTASRLLTDLVSETGRNGGGPVNWRVPGPTPEHRRIATNAGLIGGRTLWQMRCPLPTPWRSELPVRAFVVGADDAEWLRVNNAAFAWHAEQSGLNREHLQRLLDEPWFDPDGFLVHPVDGAMLGFCWTKIHHDLDPPLGEIFVIGVDPAAAGHGLGRQLLLAGLDHLTARGIDCAMLYTEADNEAATALYTTTGFTVHHTIEVFSSDRQTPTPTTEPMP